VPPDRVATPRPGVGVPPLRNLALVAAGGAAGAVARVGLAVTFPVADRGFPWTTFAENVAGAFALALVLTLLAERFTTDRSVRLLVCTGALGAFTTYSTLAAELSRRMLDGHLTLAVTYAAASVTLGLFAAFVGARAARSWPWIPRWVMQRLGRRGRP
jgi:fluoride exporter